MPHPYYPTASPPSSPPSSSPSPPPPPPTIGKIGPYTVFVTPKPSPSPPASAATTVSGGGGGVGGGGVPPPPRPPVQLPPIQYPASPVDRFGFLRYSLLKLQHVHASVDEYMANWLGLDQSKYQWALNDYYQANLPLEKGDVLTKEVSNKRLTV